MLCEAQLDWHALFVLTGQENNVKERLSYRFGERFRVLVPKRRLRERKGGNWSDIIRILFPGYILINGCIGPEEYYEIKDTPGLLSLLHSGSDILKIDRYEMSILSRLICNSEIIGFSDILIENGRAIVIDGPLASMEGIIKSINHRKGRAKVMLNFLGEERLVELGVRLLQPCV